MNGRERRRTFMRYGLIAVALLGLIVWLAHLRRQWDLAAREIASGVTVEDLTGEVPRLRRVLGPGARERWLLQTRFGGMRLVVLDATESPRLQLRRVSHEAALPVAGELAAVHATVVDGRVGRHTLAPDFGTLVSYRPYTAHALSTQSGAEASVALAFSSAPYEGPPIPVADDDERVALGSSPEIFDAEPLLEQLRASGAPEIRRPLPTLEGRIALVAVSSEVAIEPRSGLSAFWVLSGRGRTVEPVERALRANHLALVREQTPLRIAARPGAPLLLVDYQPDRLDLTSIVRNEKQLYSQYSEELLIRDFFRDQRDGSFLDVGCADYRRLSTTYYLEQRLGWSGLAVDALADYAAGYAAHRPRTRFFNFLVGDVSSGPREFYRVRRFPELSSAARPEAADLERRSGGSEVDELNVPTITLNDLLSREGVERIDFLSMDIEGHEPQALAGFDIDRYRPRLVCIEAVETNADRIYAYFRKHGYARIEKYLPFDPRNWYFAPESPPSTDGRPGSGAR